LGSAETLRRRLSPAKNSIDRKERLIHRGVKGSRELLTGRDSVSLDTGKKIG